MSLKTGSEGPRYDPYHYTQLTVHTQRGDVTLHAGLGDWCEARTATGKIRADGEEEAAALFERVVGVAPHHAMRAYEKLRYELPYRRHAAKCPERDFREESGYPGESFVICPRCHEVLETHFDRSAIE